MSYEVTLNAYRALLQQNPGKALVIGSDSAAILRGNDLCGAFLDDQGSVDPDALFDFDRSAWNTRSYCWDCDGSEAKTRSYIEHPRFLDMPFAGYTLQELGEINAVARSEGWALVESFKAGQKTSYWIEMSAKGSPFRTDDEALAFVQNKATAGSYVHHRALVSQQVGAAASCCSKAPERYSTENS